MWNQFVYTRFNRSQLSVRFSSLSHDLNDAATRFPRTPTLLPPIGDLVWNTACKFPTDIMSSLSLSLWIKFDRTGYALGRTRAERKLELDWNINRDVVYDKSGISQDFPGGPVVKILSYHCRGHRFESVVRKLRSHKPPGVAKKKEKEKKLAFPKGQEGH